MSIESTLSQKVYATKFLLLGKFDWVSKFFSLRKICNKVVNLSGD